MLASGRAHHRDFSEYVRVHRAEAAGGVRTKAVGTRLPITEVATCAATSLRLLEKADKNAALTTRRAGLQMVQMYPLHAVGERGKKAPAM